MVVWLLGGSGAGKTTVAKRMEKYVKDSFVIDGDEIRAEKNNFNLDRKGRMANMMEVGKRARRLSSLGFTVFVAAQFPYKELRDSLVAEGDVQVIMENHGDNPKDRKGYNKNFNPNYDGIDNVLVLQDFDEKAFYQTYFPKVLVPARFQGFHKGHKVIMEEAKRLSPNVTIGLRVDGDDIIDLNKNIALLESRGYKVIKTPNIDDDWTSFADEYDVYVQGNPMVIAKFDKSKCKLHHVPRYGDVSGTGIRENLHESSHQIDEDVAALVGESLDK